MKRITVATLVALGGALSQTAAAAPGSHRPVVVELFTSQGCSSCPPANANLIELSRRPDVLTLSFAVTYWDRLGWADIFGKPEFTERQVVYEPALGQAGPFTPQVVVDGRRTTVGNRLSDIEALIAADRADAGPTIDLAGGKAAIAAAPAPAGGADVWLVHYEPGIIAVPVRRGENAGRTLPHGHVVRRLTHVGDWTGTRATFALPPPADGLKSAVLVQARHGGPILAAATD